MNIGCRVVTSMVAWCLALAAHAGPAAAEDMPVRGGLLEYAVLGTPNTTDCHGATSYAVLHYVAPHYSLLVKFDPDRYPDVTGDVAESWSVSADGLTYTFQLKAGVVFHDGTALTSADVKASFDRIRRPPPGVVSANQSIFAVVSAIEAPDPATVVFRLSRPQGFFLGTLANPFNCIYAAARLAADPQFPARQVMGSGPFRFVEHVPGSHWKGERFAGYFRPGRPMLDGFRAITFAQSAAVTTALQSGQIHASFVGFPPPARDRLKAAMGERLAVYESSWALSTLLAFNSNRAPFDDARVRRALNISIDRWAGAENLARIASLRSVGATQRPGSPWAASVAELEQLPGFARDMTAARAEARRLLAEAGRTGLKLRLANRNLPDPYVTAGVFLIDQWRRIGVEAEHQVMELKSFDSVRSSGDFDAILDFSNALVDDPELELTKYISRDRSQINTARYIDRDLDHIFDRIVDARDPVERRALTRDFERRLYQQSYMMPVLWNERITMMSARVKGWKVTPSHLINQDLTDVWLQP